MRESIRDPRPLIAHIVFRFDYGGLENGLVNVANGLPEDAFRHTIIALTEASDFSQRIRRDDVTVHEINKQPGKDPAAYVRLFRLLRKIHPAVVHTRNLGTIEGAMVACLAGVPVRIHGEHGWDVYDPDGTNRRYRTMRRMMNPMIDRFVAVSRELEQWLVGSVGIRPTKLMRICNGVDTEKFRPATDNVRSMLPSDVFPAGTVVVGSVTRFSEIKDPLNLVEAFINARQQPAGEPLRLAMFGDGDLRAKAQRMLDETGQSGAAWLPGSRNDVAELMRQMDVFALGSRREGISNTVLEAMASGLPVIASATGGNLELVEDSASGFLVPPGDPQPIARALLDYTAHESLRLQHGRFARLRVEQNYSLRRMLSDYEQLYRTFTDVVREAA